MTYLGFNNKDYKIVDAEWTGNWEALPGSDMMNRSATFTISVYATGWIARYEEGEEGERTGTATASYSFEDTASQEDGLYRPAGRSGRAGHWPCHCCRGPYSFHSVPQEKGKETHNGKGVTAP